MLNKISNLYEYLRNMTVRSNTLQPEITFNESQAKDIIATQFPALQPLQSTDISNATKSLALLINDQYIFKFPLRQADAENVEFEIKLLENINPYLDIAIPQPIHHGQPGEDYPYHFFGYKKIAGESAHKDLLLNYSQSHYLKQIAKFLKQLHGIPEVDLKKMQIRQHDSLDTYKSEMIDRLNKTFFAFESLKKTKLNLAALQKEIQDITPIDLREQSQRLVHGDLWLSNILVEQDEITGILDWGLSEIHYTTIDLAHIWVYFPEKDHQQFFKIYGAVSKEMWIFARFIAIVTTLQALYVSELYGYEDLTKRCLDSIQRLNPSLLSSHTHQFPTITG